MKSNSNEVSKVLHHWCDVAYERELSAALEVLHGQFHKWKEGLLNVHELNESIHEFHQGPAKDLYSRFVIGRTLNEWLVVGAVMKGLIAKEELPTELLSVLEPKLSCSDEDALR